MGEIPGFKDWHLPPLRHELRRDGQCSKGSEGCQGGFEGFGKPHLPPLRHELRHDGQQAAARPPQGRPLPLRQRDGLLRPKQY